MPAPSSTQGLLRNETALEELAARIDRNDRESSSHWRKFHQSLHYENGKITGAVGFGTWSPPYRGLRWLGHRLLQRRFREHGQRFSSFARIDHVAARITEAQSRAYDLDVLRQSLTCAMLCDTVPDKIAGSDPAIIIGDGFGTLSAIMLAAFPRARMILVNLSQSLLADLVSIRLAFPKLGLVLTRNQQALASALSDPDLRVIAIAADDYQLIESVPAALAINIASMQEMRPDTIAGYFDALRRGKRAPITFYCCNREEKILPGGEVTRLADYPWHQDDKIIFDELCLWHQEYYVLHPPFYRPYDGPHRHRLVELIGPSSASAG
jgi:putative sugar O-methyltransferase